MAVYLSIAFVEIINVNGRHAYIYTHMCYKYLLQTEGWRWRGVGNRHKYCVNNNICVNYRQKHTGEKKKCLRQVSRFPLAHSIGSNHSIRITNNIINPWTRTCESIYLACLYAYIGARGRYDWMPIVVDSHQSARKRELVCRCVHHTQHKINHRQSTHHIGSVIFIDAIEMG